MSKTKIAQLAKDAQNLLTKILQRSNEELSAVCIEVALQCKAPYNVTDAHQASSNYNSECSMHQYSAVLFVQHDGLRIPKNSQID